MHAVRIRLSVILGRCKRLFCDRKLKKKVLCGSQRMCAIHLDLTVFRLLFLKKTSEKVLCPAPTSSRKLASREETAQKISSVSTQFSSFSSFSATYQLRKKKSALETFHRLSQRVGRLFFSGLFFKRKGSFVSVGVLWNRKEVLFHSRQGTINKDVPTRRNTRRWKAVGCRNKS